MICMIQVATIVDVSLKYAHIAADVFKDSYKKYGKQQRFFLFLKILMI